MAELLKSCRNKTCRHTLLGPMERSRRGYSFTDLVPCLTDQFGRLRHLQPHHGFEDNPALPHRNRSAHAARFTALTIPVMMICAVQGVHRNALELHPLLHRGDLGDPSPCSPPNEPPVHRCPHRQVASITVMPSYAMVGNVFLHVLVNDQDIIIAGVCGISDGEA